MPFNFDDFGGEHVSATKVNSRIRLFGVSEGSGALRIYSEDVVDRTFPTRCVP